MLYPRSYALLILMMACSYALVGLLTLRRIEQHPPQ